MSADHTLLKDLNYIRELKSAYDFKVIDVHFHPHDVMGVVHPCDYGTIEYVDEKADAFLKKELAEYVKYGFIMNVVSRIYHAYLPSAVKKAVKKYYSKYGSNRVLREMDKTHIDLAFALPVLPWVSRGDNELAVKGARFRHFESVDIHESGEKDIERQLRDAAKDGVVGIKLHPNLQDFKPQPSDNEATIERRLKKVYMMANELKLIVLFHAGITNFTDKALDKSYRSFKRSRDNGIIENFISSSGRSEVFEIIKTPVILAHFGVYGLLRYDMTVQQQIAKRYDNAYFDTAGCSPAVISEGVRVLPTNRILFGTDAQYYKMAFSLAHVVEGVRRAISDEARRKKVISRILGLNAMELLQMKSNNYG